MVLVPGTRLGVYEVTALIGEGGMGHVYRARDTTLNRDVALKILPDAFARDPDRLARFQREAHVLASLNHPNIAHVHGLDETGGVRALVMELVEGEDLSQRIARGAIPLDETLPIAKQIAEALDAAHAQGIVHRDIKPANIKVRPDATVKVLDFGLAKAVDPPAGTGAAAALANSPTLTSAAMMTGVGVILGTAPYMSPEQAKGRPADKRGDVWAFGCVLYEMLTGRRAFPGEDVSDTLAAVLNGEPDWNALPSNLPPGIRALIQGCLLKDRKERIGDISTARFLLSQPHRLTPSAVNAPSPVWRLPMLVVAGGLIGAAVAASLSWRREPFPAVPVARFALTLPQGQQLALNRHAVTLSPAGTHIVYASERGLFLRSVSELEASPIPGADLAINPVFSPDGHSLAFYGDGAIKRIAVSGGTAVTICQIGGAPSSMAWAGDYILFSQFGPSIMRVTAHGGQPEVLVALKNSGEVVYGPQLLPGGGTLLFTIVNRTNAAIDRWTEAQIVVQSLDTGERKTLIEGGSDARYVPTGHIVYAVGGTLFAKPFDLTNLEVTGVAVPVLEGVRRVLGSAGAAHFAFSNAGSLVYVPGPASSAQQELMLFDRKGGAKALGLPPGRYQYPRVSPDGNRIAFETSDGKEAVVSIYEVSGESSIRRLTFGGNNRLPIWSADGRRVAFQSDREGDPAVFWQPADGGTAERLTHPGPGTSHAPESWSPDGGVLLFSETRDAVSSLWTFSLRGRTATPFGDVRGSSLPTNATFSPDGRWVAYQIGVAGMGEGTTYVQPFPPTGTKYEIARGGRPLWSRDGTELFFVPAPTQFMVVNVRTAPSFAITSPVAVPRGFGIAAPAIPRTFDIMRDGRIVGVGTPAQGPGGSAAASVIVVLNWFEELKAKAPVGK
ncbi:MAG: protein kinase [Vicinamibacterales bacterium]